MLLHSFVTSTGLHIHLSSVVEMKSPHSANADFLFSFTYENGIFNVQKTKKSQQIAGTFHS